MMEKNKMLTNKRFRRFLSEFNQIVEAYCDSYIKKKVDWVEYERDYRDRIRYVSAELNNIVNEATSFIIIDRSNRGRRPKLTQQKNHTKGRSRKHIRENRHAFRYISKGRCSQKVYRKTCLRCCTQKVISGIYVPKPKGRCIFSC